MSNEELETKVKFLETVLANALKSYDELLLRHDIVIQWVISKLTPTEMPSFNNFCLEQQKRISEAIEAEVRKSVNLKEE